MTIFLLKSLLSLLMLALAASGVYTMFEVFGREAQADRAKLLKRRHKFSGWAFVLLFVMITYLCIGFLVASKAEPSPRVALHILIALALIALFIIKVLFVRVYRQFYSMAKTIGISMGILTFVLVGLTAGVYLTTSRFGQDLTTDKSAYYALQGPFLSVHQTGAPPVTAIRTDSQSIARGRTLFVSRCSACHDPESTTTKVGPGLKGLLKNPVLPVSKHPATAESLRFQLRQPMGAMPSFASLSDDEMNDLIAYLNTL
jgi:mono/diheme cytochrome c family protein